MLKFNDVAYLSINVKGTNIFVTVTKKAETLKSVEQSNYCNIIAKKDGIIEKVIARSGNSVVQKGDIVRKRDVLINGSNNKSIPEVWATTFYEASKSASYEEVVKEIRYKSSEEFIKFLDKKCMEFENEYFNLQALNAFDEEIVPLNEVEELFEKHYKYMPLFRRSQKVKRVLISKLKDKRDEKVREINAEFKAKLEVMSDDEKNIEQNNLEFQRRNDIRDVVREVMNVKSDLENWIDNESIVDIYKKFMNIDMLSYLDLPAILYLMIKLDGKKSKAEIRHIVIDEAQDYSMLQFLVLQGLTGCRSYTVVGDVNQRLVKIDEVPAMLRLEDIYGKFVKRFDLNKSYRSTQQIMEYASKLLDENAIVPFVRKGKYDVEEVEINDKEDLIDTILETLEKYDDENYENIAVITKDKNELQIIAPELKKFTKIMAFDKADIIYRGGKVIVPSYYAKGLEFDGVVVVNFDDNTDDLVKYIMVTRALHQLKIINYREK